MHWKVWIQAFRMRQLRYGRMHEHPFRPTPVDVPGHTGTVPYMVIVKRTGNRIIRYNNS